MTLNSTIKPITIKPGLRFKSKDFQYEVLRIEAQTVIENRRTVIKDMVILKEKDSSIEIPTSLDGAQACFRQKIWIPLN